MSNKFLTSGGSSTLDDGTADIWINSCQLSNTDASKPVRTSASNILVSGDTQISEVTGLQGILDNTLQNPFNGTLQATDIKTNSVRDITENSRINLNSTEIDLVANSVLVNGQTIGQTDLQTSYNISSTPQITTNNNGFDIKEGLNDNNITFSVSDLAGNKNVQIKNSGTVICRLLELDSKSGEGRLDIRNSSLSGGRRETLFESDTETGIGYGAWVHEYSTNKNIQRMIVNQEDALNPSISEIDVDEQKYQFSSTELNLNNKKITGSAEPTIASDLATKQYVDNQAGGGNPFDQNLNQNNDVKFNQIETPLILSDTSNVITIGQDGTFMNSRLLGFDLIRSSDGLSVISSFSPGLLSIVSPEINFNASRLQNVADPVDLQDSTTKQYVDTQISNIPATDLTDLETKTQNISLTETDNTKTTMTQDLILDSSTGSILAVGPTVEGVGTNAYGTRGFDFDVTENITITELQVFLTQWQSTDTVKLAGIWEDGNPLAIGIAVINKTNLTGDGLRATGSLGFPVECKVGTRYVVGFELSVGDFGSSEVDPPTGAQIVVNGGRRLVDVPPNPDPGFTYPTIIQDDQRASFGTFLYEINGLKNLTCADPISPQHATTKHYVDFNNIGFSFCFGGNSTGLNSQNFLQKNGLATNGSIGFNPNNIDERCSAIIPYNGNINGFTYFKQNVGDTGFRLTIYDADNNVLTDSDVLTTGRRGVIYLNLEVLTGQSFTIRQNPSVSGHNIAMGRCNIEVLYNRQNTVFTLTSSSFNSAVGLIITDEQRLDELEAKFAMLTAS